MMSVSCLESAYRYCEEVTKKHAKSFYFAAKFLPKQKQPAVFAIYAFCRHVDDEIDEGGDRTESAAAMAVDDWRQRLDAVYGSTGSQTGPESIEDPREKALADVFLAWSDMLAEYPVPKKVPLDLIRGVLMDTYKKRYSDFDELYLYCYHVASTVGLMSSEVLGYSDPAALEYAEKLGVAMQLTNILRDVREDAEMGRIYLPAEELGAFGVSEKQIFDGIADGNFRKLMRFQVDRARSLYGEGEKGIGYLSPDSRFTVLLASRIYARILNEIEALDYDVFSKRAHTTKTQKLLSMPRIWLESKSLQGKPAEAE